jgi:two-component system, LytTR family, response regulator
VSGPVTTPSVRALIVDDEPIARAGIREMLAAEKDIVVVGEAGDGLSAAEEIIAKRPDLVFLDIQMPEVDGFGVIEAVGPGEMPVVVFVTAFDEYAVRAFEVHALDYLLKPVDPDRFRRTILRVRSRMDGRGGDAPVSAMMRTLRGLPGSGPYPERMLIRTPEKVIVVDTRSIEWIAAEGDYVRLRWKGGTLTARSTLAAMESRLDPARFARIHRSTIVSVPHVRELRPLFSGDHAVILHDGTKFNLSRLYKAKLFALLGDSSAGKIS